MSTRPPLRTEGSPAPQQGHVHASAPPGNPEWLELVARQVKSLRFGAVQILVHEGRVTQVEATEKFRLGET